MHDAGDEHDGRAGWLVRAAGDVLVDEICGEQSVMIGSRRFRVVGADEVTGTVSLVVEDAD